MTANVARSTPVLLVGVLALAAAGCGGGGSELSEDEVIDEFDTVCEDVNDELDDIEAEFGDLAADDEGGAAALREEVGDVLAGGLAELSEIDPPESLHDEVDELLERVEDRTHLLPDLAEAIADEDGEAIDDVLDEVAELDADTRAISEAIGLDCYVGVEEQ